MTHSPSSCHIFDLIFDKLIINTHLYRFDRTLGGLEMEIRLRDHLAELFTKQKKTPNSVYDSPRAMAKLLKEAKRVKKVLSANADHYSQVGTVYPRKKRVSKKTNEYSAV